MKLNRDEETKNYLIQEYSNNKRSTVEIAKLNNCSPSYVYNLLVYLEIKIKHWHKPSLELNEEELKNKYINEKLSIRKIARIYNVSPTAIRKRLIKFNIFRRRNNDYYKDLRNCVFGKLLVLDISKNITKNEFKGKRKIWRCKCKCGNIVDVVSTALISGNTISCGCIRRTEGPTHPTWKGYEEIGIEFFNSMKNGAAIRNLEFNITIEYIWELFIKQSRKCALSGIDLRTLTRYKRTASLDRIDNTKGYIEGNLQWIHKDINIMKRDHTQEYFIDICNKISDYQRNKNEQL